jgi:hypothetical protein
MSKTKDKPRTIEAAEVALEEVRTRLAGMRSELAELSEPPQIGWDGVSPETLSKIAEADSKRTALPHAMSAGELRELELQREIARLRRPTAARKIQEAYADWQAADEEARRAQEHASAKNHEWLEAIRHNQDLEMEERRLEREIAERKAAANRSREALAAPVVRSVWQQQTKDGGPGWWKW